MKNLNVIDFELMINHKRLYAPIPSKELKSWTSPEIAIILKPSLHINMYLRTIFFNCSTPIYIKRIGHLPSLLLHFLKCKLFGLKPPLILLILFRPSTLHLKVTLKTSLDAQKRRMGT